MTDPDHSTHAPAEDVLNLVGFRIEDWRFAVRLAQVRTSIMPCPVTRVFHVPDYVQGIISLRGTIVGVLDLGRLLGLTGTAGGFRRLIIVSARNVQAAIPVHDVFRVPDVSVDRVGPLPSSVGPTQRQYLEGIINTSGMETRGSGDEDTITLVDAAMLFESPALRALRGEP